ncbi:MAG: hypothetical protein AAGJ38_10870, partial [Planctomycetota bacterium]
MKLEDVDVIEDQFEVKLPSDYRIFLVDYPFATDNEELTANLEELVKTNLGLRNDKPWGFSWERRFWWCGSDGSGGIYFLDCNQNDSMIYYLDHENPADVIQDQEKLKPRSLSRR